MSLLFFQEYDFLKRDFDAMKLENEAVKQQMEIKDRLIKVGLSECIFICVSGSKLPTCCVSVLCPVETEYSSFGNQIFDLKDLVIFLQLYQ